MNAKIAMVLVALIGVGLFALPQTTALFAGQHSFTNIDATGNQIDCVKCHGDVQAELGTMGHSETTNTSGPHATFKCEYCHRIEAGSSSGDNAYGRVEYKVGGHGVPGGSRYLVLTIKDMEAMKFPENVTANATKEVIANLTMKSGSTMYDEKIKFSVSGCKNTYNGTICNNGTEELPTHAPAWRIYPLYDSQIGAPIDTNNVTKDTGFKPEKVTFNSTTNNVILDGAGSKAVNPGTAYHAASLVSCMECHGGVEPMGHYTRVLDGDEAASCEQCHYGGGNYKWTELGAGGFGLTAYADDNGSSEAHTEFVTTNDKLTRYKYEASNGACVACHTHVAVEINYTRPSTYKFDANFFSNGKEEVGSFSATGMNSSNSSGN